MESMWKKQLKLSSMVKKNRRRRKSDREKKKVWSIILQIIDHKIYIYIYILSYWASILLINFLNKICIIFNNFLKNKDIIVQLKYPQILMNYEIEWVHFVLDFVCIVALTFQLFS